MTMTREQPLPLREQTAVRDRWLETRLRELLPALMDRADRDLWLVFGREYNEARFWRPCCPPNAIRASANGMRIAPHCIRPVDWSPTSIRPRSRLPAEIAATHSLNRLAHDVIAEAFSAAVIAVGSTTVGNRMQAVTPLDRRSGCGTSRAA